MQNLSYNAESGLNKILWVGIGGFFGASLRHLIGELVTRLAGNSAFPHSTLIVNLLGCLLIGTLLQLSATQTWFSPELRLLFVTGFLGSLTTFSTFGNDAVSLMQSDQHHIALAYLALHLVLGLGAVWLGQTAAGLLTR